MHSPDICIAGAGLIGLSLALELHAGGAHVTVLEAGDPLAQASTAAAGMLAARDPENPPELQQLADLSITLYRSWLDRISNLSEIPVSFHSSATLQALPAHSPTSPHTLSNRALAHLLPQLYPGHHRFLYLDEHSLDPRELATSLLAAVRATSIDLRAHTPIRQARSGNGSVEVQTATSIFHAAQFVDCAGAWSASWQPLPQAALNIAPSKGQMLSLALPPSLPLNVVVRTPDIYIVPRTRGVHAGRAIVGATVEDAGFDKTVHRADIARLHALAAELLPELASATVLESWAGLRPATADRLPLLGPLPDASGCFIAAGHYRNGILLAPATAHVMSQMLSGGKTTVDLSAFSPLRATLATAIAH